MRILYLGDDWLGSNARSLADGFRRAGHDVVVIDSTEVTLPTRLSVPWWYSKLARRRAPWRVAAVHERLEAAAAEFKPDLLFAFKAVHLDQQRLLSTPAPLRVHYSPDDVANAYNTTPDYLAYERDWDMVVTTKSYNVAELHARGVAAALFVRSAYDPSLHYPCARRDTRRFLAGFIGACRPDRRAAVIELADTYGERLLVRGPGWRRVPSLRRTDAVLGGAVYGADFSAAVASVTANLVLLNSDNRDTQTCRTFEVPAAGGLFVGERTDEHAALLDDGTECFLFSEPAELHDILGRCAADPALASRVAAAGCRRIRTEWHSYVDRAREIIDALG
ncbi:glycosyltransferase [Nocardia sp. NPDC052566]|uniref:CgeB family protein n=1 Tax=Nocardia sp. NPDC052566 TaxID=3364330 RepID=UPI0037C74465